MSQQAVDESAEKVTKAQADTAAKQAEFSAKDTALKEKQAEVKQATTALNQSKDELKAYKGINLPANFTPDYYKVLSEAEKVKMEKEALEMNKDFPMTEKEEAEKSATMINIYNPTAEQKQYMSDYFVGLLNAVREKFGLQPLKVSNQAIKFSWDVAKYVDSKVPGHDEKAINKAAKENGFKEYPGLNYYENLSGGYFQPKDGVITLLDFEKAARDTLIDMLFNDGRMSYGHTESLLRADKTNTAIALSEENDGFESGKIHIIGYAPNKLVDPATYEAGTVPTFKSKEAIQKEIAEKETKLAQAKEAEKSAEKEKATVFSELHLLKQEQTAVEKELASKKAKLTEAQTAFTKSDTAYKEKVGQRTAAEKTLATLVDKLSKIQAFLDTKEAILQDGEVRVVRAKESVSTSEKVLKEKQADQKAEAIVLAHLTDIQKQRQAELTKVKQKLVASQQALSRLENAQPNYESAVKKLEEAEMKLDKVKAEYQASVKRLAQLKEERSIANDTYKQAQAMLDKEVQYLAILASDLQSAKEQKEKEELQQQIAQEQARLEKEASQKEMSMQGVTSAKKENPVMAMSSRKGDMKKETKQAKTPMMKKAKNVEKSNVLPNTGEERNEGMFFGGLAIFAGLLGLASADLKRRYKKAK